MIVFGAAERGIVAIERVTDLLFHDAQWLGGLLFLPALVSLICAFMFAQGWPRLLCAAAGLPAAAVVVSPIFVWATRIRDWGDTLGIAVCLLPIVPGSIAAAFGMVCGSDWL